MKRGLPLLLVVALVVLLGAVAIAEVIGGGNSEAAGYTNKALKGGWGFAASGNITGSGFPFPAGTPLASMGLVTFDGKGGCAAVEQLNIGGTEIPPGAGNFRTTSGDGACGYTVNSDGTGVITVTFGPSQPIAGTTAATFVLVDSKKEFRFIGATTPGFLSYGVFKRQ